MSGQIEVGGLSVEVVRKRIKNLHLGVYPPNGRVRVSVPLTVSDDAVRALVTKKLSWIQRHQARIETQARESRRQMVSGESHYFLGRRYRLNVVEGARAGHVAVRSGGMLDLHVRHGSDARARERVLQGWYRERLREAVPPLLTKWEAVLGVSVTFWGVKRMKTKWGSCNVTARRVWLNLELVKKPERCLEYLVVHELVHLIELRHNDRFAALMDEHLPGWRDCRDELNHTPLPREDWVY